MPLQVHSLTDIINDLVSVNCDRADYYEEIVQVNDFLNDELTELLNDVVSNCRYNSAELIGFITSLETQFSQPAEEFGEIYDAWGQFD